MKKLLFFVGLVILAVSLYNSCSDNALTTSYIPVPQSQRDKYGLLASDYDKNGWAKVRGEWVSNPRAGTLIVYSNGAATSSTRVGSIVSNYSSTSSYRNFSSIRETYPILERVARNLQYSDIPALYNSARNWEQLPAGHYYERDGYKFYSQPALLEYKIQKAQAWGSKNDQNGDGKINCQDYAELFYKYASEAGYHVRYIVNSQLDHAFNAVNVSGYWIAIEPQAAEDDGLDRSPEMSVHWKNYNPSYDTVRKQI
jgi:hypothetical protein